jgi:hypothetical protein
VKTWHDTDNRGDPSLIERDPLDGDLARLGLNTGWLVPFDQRSGVPPLEGRTRVECLTLDSGRTVSLIRTQVDTESLFIQIWPVPAVGDGAGGGWAGKARRGRWGRMPVASRRRQSSSRS